LIGPREGERIWERHIFNCLPVTQLLPQGASLFDIGSGAGLPGIVIALARPDLTVTLIEPLERRVSFLNEAVVGLNIEVIRGRAQDVKKSADFVTARAVAPLEKLKKMSWHMVKTGGSLLAMKGESASAEMEGVKGATLHEITLDGIGLGRIVAIKKGA
jgi:16S rRNA (guanine527-N7)-methyltransferase